MVKPQNKRSNADPECNLNLAVKLQRKAIVGIFGVIAVTSAYLSFLAFATFYSQHGACNTPPLNGKVDVEEEPRTLRSAKYDFVTSNKKASPSISTSEMAKKFYQNHWKTIQSTINRDTELFWGANDKPPFPVFQKALGVKPNIIHGPNPTNKIDSSPLIALRDVCKVSLAFKAYRNSSIEPPPFPHVVLLRMNENWGSFSRYVENRTTPSNNWVWHNTEETWKDYGCTQADIEAYLDGPDLQAAVTVQHQFLDHPKVHSLPLGFRSWRDMPMVLRTLGNSTSLDRPQLLMINSNPHKWRLPLLNKVIEDFYGTVNNTFGYNGIKGNDRFQAYLNEMRRSKFILSPPGLGLDCYRHWEAMHMGTFPVIEHLNRTDGWHRTLADLPVAWIDSYENLTPEFLEKEYERLIAKTYKYEKLTRQYWIQMIKAFLPAENLATNTKN